MGGNMKKIFVLLTTLALLTLTACISKDAKGKLEETTTPPSTVVVPETPAAPTIPTSGNLITLFDSSKWSSASDANTTISTSLANNEMTATYTSKSASEYSQANVEIGKALTGITAVKISYKSNHAINLKFKQSNFNANTGYQYYQVTLPASPNFVEVTKNVSEFNFPQWKIDEADFIAANFPLDLGQVTSIDLSPELPKDGNTYTFTVNNLELINFKF